MVIDRFRYEDRDAIDALYRRVFGPDAAEASRLRWDWQYRLNPQNPGTGPLIWIAREGPSIIGQYATMPVALSVKGQDVVGSWGMDAYWPMMDGPSRAIQISGPVPGFCGLRRYCQSQRSRLASAASGPNTRR